MKIFNERTKQVEEFKSIYPNKILMYVCGPTLYSDIHIGNARPIIFFDFVRTVFEKKGYKVVYASNITDVDDKIINKALELNISEKELLDINFVNFNNILSSLNIKYDYQPTVTETMDEIIAFIQELVINNYAYEIDGDIYFDISSINNYGVLSNVKLDENYEATRIDVNNKKKNPNDFVLWKKTEKGIKWSSPWSVGRPGWHSECVVMINKFLGEKIDIHGGGIDLQFPHHENENAQSCALHGELANYWMHNGFIKVNDEKMSKSLGNTFLVKDFLDKFSANILKLIMYQTHYRQPINITNEFIYNTKKLDQKIYNYFQNLETDEVDFNLGKTLDIACNDFDTPNLLTYLLKVMKSKDLENQKIFNAILKILNLNYHKEELPENILLLIEQRNHAKQNKDFEKADAIRQEINNLGYEVFDTREGTKCQKTKN